MTHDRSNQSRRPQNKSPRELELKLAVPEASGDALVEHLRLRTPKASQVQQRHEVTTYFDTSNQLLARGGMSLRVRISDNRRVQTLKANRRDGVAADRAEWEWP